MKKLILILALFSTVAYGMECTFSTIYINGRQVVCKTCCVPGGQCWTECTK